MEERAMAGKSDATERERLGGKVRLLRRRQGLSQAHLADKLGVSPSYLNLIENNRRPLPAALLLKLASLFHVQLDEFASDEEGRVIADLLEAFSDPIFEDHPLTSTDVRELTASSPAAARAVLTLYAAYQSAREGAETLAARLHEKEDVSSLERSGLAVDVRSAVGVDVARIPSEEVNDLVQRQMNWFPALEDGADELWRAAHLDRNDLYAGLVRRLAERHRVTVRVAEWADERGTLRRYDPERRVLVLSELLPTRSRSFQLAHQLALLEHGDLLDELIRGEAGQHLSSDTSRALARVALASYYAGAVLMPYAAFQQAARSERYDVDVLGRRFRVGFEQVCHRLTTLRRPGAEGVPFHMMRIDVGGNISKRFSASGIRFARFSGICPRWNIFAAFQSPGQISIQVSRMPDGADYLCIARTVQRDAGGYHSHHSVQAVALGCKLEYARELVYADGVDLDDPHVVVPVGVTCRICERTDCEQRALPSIRQPLRVDENIRQATLYTTPERSSGGSVSGRRDR
jgi:predicted transcriptional regulator/transcriptional regulator with XRE-family HTH domain